MTKTMLIAALALAMPACGKNKDHGGSSQTSDQLELPAELASWMPADAAKLFDGSWAGHLTLRTSGTMSMAGDPAAVTIKGDAATVYDGKTDQKLKFAVQTPCEAGFTIVVDKGTRVTFPVNYVVRGGALQIGSGAVGLRKGKAAVACVSMGPVTIDDAGKCQHWSSLMRQWESKPETCAWSQKDGKDVLTIGTGDFASVLTADGDTLVTEQWQEEQKEQLWKHADDAAARAWVVAETKKHDPGEIAKAAGGKVGDLTTVAGLQATYAADKAGTKGKPVELTALYLNANSASAGGKTTYNVVVVDGKDKLTPDLMCETKEEAKGFVQYDKVTVKGAVGDFMDNADLTDCTVAKAP